MNSNQPNYAEDAENFAKEPPLQLTLRVMQTIYSNPRFWVGMAAMIMVLTIMGPFNTLTGMHFAPRLVYWGGVSLVTFPAGMAASTFFGIWLFYRGMPEALSRLVGGALGGIPLGGIVYIANTWFARTMDGSFSDLIRLTAYTVPISAAISVIYYLIETSLRSHVAEVTETLPHTSPIPGSKTEPAFFKRLPVELGKDIISLQAQDHYVKVTTIKGSEMILLRLADAEQELSELEGIRVHRSWWITRRHISKLGRENDKWTAVLSNGEIVPVSRSYVKQVRQWFDQPGKGNNGFRINPDFGK